MKKVYKNNANEGALWPLGRLAAPSCIGLVGNDKLVVNATHRPTVVTVAAVHAAKARIEAQVPSVAMA